MAVDPRLLAVADQFLRAGAFVQAHSLYRRMLEQEAENAELWRRLGEARQALGQRREAEAAYEESLSRSPDAGTFNNLGVVLLEPGRLEDAAAAFREALRLLPDFAEAHNNLGLALAEMGRLPEAVGHYRQAIRRKPDYAVAYHNLGKALARQGKAQEAEEYFRQATRLRPEYAPAHFHFGELLFTGGRLAEAVAAYRAGLKAAPGDARAFNDLGRALLDGGQVAEAADAFTEAARLQPDFAPAYNNLGLALTRLGRLDDARVRIEQALFLAPDYAEAHHNLGRVLADKGMADEALDAFERAVRISPNAPGPLNNLANAYKEQGRLDEAVACYRQALFAAPLDAPVHSNLLFALLYHGRATPEEVFSEHLEFGRRHTPPAEESPATFELRSGSRLRVGYVSPDFKEHVMGSFSELVLAAHDRARIEVFCYSDVQRPDATTERIRALAEHWRPLTGLSHAQAAERIRRDGIDVLVDWAGHTGGNRLPMFALRPAPVQATHFGYLATTGLAAMDYRLTDAHVDPPGLTEALHTEKLIRLPAAQWCYRGGPEWEIGPSPAQATGRVAFGCFNNSAKVTEETLALWSRILRELPAARFHLLAGAGTAGERRMLDAFGRGGVGPDRVTLWGRRSVEEYFRLYEAVDVCLDPFPFSGCNTTADALWMGVPVVTLAGRTPASRQSLGVLRLVGLDDLVAESPDAYAAAAVRLAGDRTRLRDLRAGLRERLRCSPLMDAAGFTRRLEAAYWEMSQARGRGRRRV